MLKIGNLLLFASQLVASLAAPADAIGPFFQLSKREIAYNASLPNITIFATGGTIAGSAPSESQTTGYRAGALGVDLLIDAVPQLLNVSNVRGVQVTNVASPAMTPDILLNMTRMIQEEVDNPYCQGVVVTHGTNTLEESAFFVELTVRTEKPIVFVGAMRPASAISADGPINLLEAVTLAGSPSARGRGTLIVLNDRIGSAMFTTKMHANSLDTFQAPEPGYLGFFLNIKPIFYYSPALPLGRIYFNSSELSDELPQVDILFAHQALNPALAAAAVDTGAKGLILAGTGSGAWTADGLEVVKQMEEEHGTVVLTATQNLGGGFVTEREGQISAWHLNPRKARIMLQLALGAGFSREQVIDIFKFGYTAA